jgi:hypothetical protein
MEYRFAAMSAVGAGFFMRSFESPGLAMSFCLWWQLDLDSGPNQHLLDGFRKASLPE